jgi:uncharacterized membrane protein
VVEDELQRAKQPLSAGLAGPYGHPFHPILVTVPIGAWVCSLVFDVASRFADEPKSFAEASMWLIGIGVLGALAAAAVGFLDFMSLPRGTPVFRTAVLHMSLNLTVTALYAVSFAWRQSAIDDAQRVGYALLGLSAICIGLLAVSGSLGGKLAYHYGVRVADENTQAQGYGPARGAGRAGEAPWNTQR